MVVAVGFSNSRRRRIGQWMMAVSCGRSRHRRRTRPDRPRPAPRSRSQRIHRDPRSLGLRPLGRSRGPTDVQRPQQPVVADQGRADIARRPSSSPPHKLGTSRTGHKRSGRRLHRRHPVARSFGTICRSRACLGLGPAGSVRQGSGAGAVGPVLRFAMLVEHSEHEQLLVGDLVADGLGKSPTGNLRLTTAPSGSITTGLPTFGHRLPRRTVASTASRNRSPNPAVSFSYQASARTTSAAARGWYSISRVTSGGGSQRPGRAPRPRSTS